MPSEESLPAAARDPNWDLPSTVTTKKVEIAACISSMEHLSSSGAWANNALAESGMHNKCTQKRRDTCLPMLIRAHPDGNIGFTAVVVVNGGHP